MMATIRWEIQRRRIALLWWTVGSALLVIGILSLFPSLRDQAHQFNQLINQLPQGLRQLKSGGSNSVNVADPVDYLNSQLFYITLPIIWIILAITRGSGILGKEEQNHTMELLLARPLSRGKLLLAKALSLTLEFIIVGGVTLLLIIILAPAFGLHIGTSHLLLATVYTLLFSLSFGLIAFALQAASRLTRGIASVLAVIISFGGYLITSLSGLSHWLENPAKATPYHYFSPDKILHGQSVTGLNMYLLGVLIFTAVVSYFGFRGRDIE